MKKIKDLSLLWIETGNDSWDCYSHINEHRVLEGTFSNSEIGKKYKPNDYEPRTQIEAVRRLHSEEQIITVLQHNNNYPESKYVGISLLKDAYNKGRKNVWEARFSYKGDRMHIGVFDCQDKAAIACNEYILENKLNRKLYQI